jgi:(2R)-sulfolactate sulfo-lyase subunit alpha
MAQQAIYEQARGSAAAASRSNAIPHVLAHSPKDNVAVVVVEGLTAGTKAMGVITEDNSTFSVDVKDDIPIGHKVALADLEKGDTVVKYGQNVGRMVASAAKGRHVHTQNMKTNRW